MKKLSTAVLLLGTILIAAQEQEEKGKQIEDIIIVGNRNAKRTKLETPVPVDVINIEKLQKSSPQMTVQDLLNMSSVVQFRKAVCIRRNRAY
jgi:iron complex outermembrane receptor protein